MMASNGPASARNSPILPRSAQNRDALFSPLPDDFLLEEKYKAEKDQVIGELASRIKGLKPQKGFDKNKRGEHGHDDALSVSLYPSTPPTIRSRATPDPSHSPAPASEVFAEILPVPKPKKLSEEDIEKHQVPSKVTQATSSATINPQRVATASIKLHQSPKVERRERGRNATRTKVANAIIPSITSVRTRSQSPSVSRMSRLAPNSYNNGSLSSLSTSRSSSRSTTPSSTSRQVPNGRLITPTTRHMTQRSISLQPPSRTRQTGVNQSQKSRFNNVGAGKSANTLTVNGGNYRRVVSVDPDLNDPEIQARIGNRATKVVNKSIGTCGTCRKAINEDGCTAFGKVYHKSCFKCAVCKQKIQGRFFEKDGKPYCAKDYQKSQEACTVCGMPIKGDSVVSNNKVFHPECMKCFVCGESLRGTYLTFQDKPICERDYKEYGDKCSSCSVTISGTCYSMNNKMLCQDCHDEQLDKCPKCEESVGGKMVKITGASYHPECFRCVECDKNMINIPFVADDKKRVYCPEDYNKKRAPKCSFCKKPIVPKDGQKTAPRLRAMGRDFHPECFQCEDCGLVLDSRVKGRECYPFKNHIYCLKCNRKKLSSSESESETDEEQN